MVLSMISINRPHIAGHENWYIVAPALRWGGNAEEDAVTTQNRWIVDGNEAAADVAYRLSELVAIYPITPASPMGEHADAWSAQRRSNLWGDVPEVVEMQSEGGAAAALHGAVQGGALGTTFTASQGLLLMIPDMYKIAGELTPAVIHVAARTVATHALSIFGDHSDVYSVRQTGWGMLASANVQQAHDFAAIAHAAALRSRVPFVHFFDGFRTSHELQRVERLDDDTLRALVPADLVAQHRRRSLSPDRPVVRGTAHNPDTFFQAREAANPFYERCPDVVADLFALFEEHTGRGYAPYAWYGHPQADRAVVVMGSASETLCETVDWLMQRGERVGVLTVHLYRPFDARRFAAALPPSVERMAVLDRTKEPGAPGEPLYLDVVAALHRAHEETGRRVPRVRGGRYGLSSKEFTPAMAVGLYEMLACDDGPVHGFTVGIEDDVTHLSLPFDADVDIEPDDVQRAVFFGLGSDGTVGANRNAVRIVGEHTDLHVQAYFVYDSKKAGARTVSHLRFSPRPLRAPYLIRRAQFVACHQWEFLWRFDVLDAAAPGATLLLNSPYPAAEVWERLPVEVQREVLDKDLAVYAIDAARIAEEAGLGRRINTVMQVAFFTLSRVVPLDVALDGMRAAIEATYGKKGREVVERNLRAIELARGAVERVPVGEEAASSHHRLPPVPPEAPPFVHKVTAAMIAGHGDALPVSAFPPDGTWPTATSQWEKRAIAPRIPSWVPQLCIECNKCVIVCPHAAIRAKVFEPERAEGAPAGFAHLAWKDRHLPGLRYTLAVAPEDCTGCRACVEVCPGRDKSNPRRKALEMVALAEVREERRELYAFFLALPDLDAAKVAHVNVKTSQLLRPLFEYSGACAGCGETPYIKLLTQLFGDRAIVANATGCSSIYGGNLPTTPYAVDARGRGPAWSNSLFEDNAEFGFGIALAVEAQARAARALLRELAGAIGDSLVQAIVEAPQRTHADIEAQRERLATLRERLAALDDPRARRLEVVAEHLVRRSVWLVGGDGWAYDIGYGGLDHVLAMGRDVNILVLDTEVYSNTGGQQSKATPLGAVAKFAAAGKATPKKDLGLLAMAHGHAYVAQVALGAKDAHTVKAFLEADSYPGPSILIALSPCIAHGYDLAYGPAHQKLAVEVGHWPLYRYDPRRLEAGESPLQLDAVYARKPFSTYAEAETRFRMLRHLDAARARALLDEAQREIVRRIDVYRHLAGAAGGHAPGEGTS